MLSCSFLKAVHAAKLRTEQGHLRISIIKYVCLRPLITFTQRNQLSDVYLARRLKIIVYPTTIFNRL